MSIRAGIILILFLAATLAGIGPAACLGENRSQSALSGGFNPARLATQTTTQPASEGAQVFSGNCAVCHGPAGKGTPTAPSLETVNDPAFIMQTVRSGKDGMPSFAARLSDAQIGAVASYVSTSIATVSLAGGDLSRGGTLFRLNCSGCHGATGRGGALVHAGENAPELTGLSPAAIATAVRGGPGPMPAFPQSVFDQHDLASIVAFVQMLDQPDHPGGFALEYRGPVTEGLAAVAVVAVLAGVAVWIERRGRG